MDLGDYKFPTKSRTFSKFPTKFCREFRIAQKEIRYGIAPGGDVYMRWFDIMLVSDIGLTNRG